MRFMAKIPDVSGFASEYVLSGNLDYLIVYMMLGVFQLIV